MPVGKTEENHADQTKKPKVDRLREQRDRLNSQIRQMEAHETNRKRREDTRRKVLIGAAIMARVNNQKDDWSEDKLLAMMDNFLTRPKERDLFGLEPLPKPQGEAASIPASKTPVNGISKRKSSKTHDDKGKQALDAPAATGVSSDAGLGGQDNNEIKSAGDPIHSQARQAAEAAIAVTSIAEEAKAATGDHPTVERITPAPAKTVPPTSHHRSTKRRLPESADENDLEKEFNI